MKVSIVSRIYRPEPSAATSFLGAIADNLITNGNEVTVFTSSLPKGYIRAASQEKIHAFPALRDKNKYIRGYLQYLSFDFPLFFRLLLSKKPDVYLVEPPPTTGLVVKLISKIKKVPYVYDVADIWSDAAIHATSSAFVIGMLLRIEKIALGGAAELITISRGVVQQLSKFNLKKRIHITGFGADTDNYHYIKAKITNTFIYAGTYSQLHGASILIDAFAIFSKKYPDYMLIFVGNGTEKHKLAELSANLGIEKKVQFVETVSPKVLNEMFSTAKASLATLLPGGGYEYAFTTKIYSSLASGCPVVFSGPGPTRDFLNEAKHSMYLGEVAEYDKYSISKALEHLVINSMSALQREQLAAWTDSNHSISRVAERVTNVLGTVVCKENNYDV